MYRGYCHNIMPRGGSASGPHERKKRKKEQKGKGHSREWKRDKFGPL